MGNTIKVLTRWKAVLLVAVLSRVALFIFSVVFNYRGQGSMLDLWIRWDGPHYIEIARHGYQNTGEPGLFIVFYPLYPFLIRLLSLTGLSLAASAVIIPAIFSITASVLLYEVARLDFNKKTALLSVWFLNIFPTSLFLQGSYTESLFLTFSLAAVYLFRKGRAWQAGLAGLLSSITRLNGILLVPLFIIEARSWWKLVITSIATPVGFAIYLLINYLTFGNFFYFAQPLKEHWFKELTFPWIGVGNLFHSLGSPDDPNFYIYLSETVALVFVFIMTLVVFLKVRLSYGYYMLLSLLLFTSTSFILSTPRYALILFPIYLALGRISNRYLLLIISLVFIGLLLVFTDLFTQGRWVS